MSKLRPYPEVDICDAESAKVRTMYNDGWEIYDTAERIVQSVASIGNMLRIIDGLIKDPDDVKELKHNAEDKELILFLDRIEDSLQIGGIALAETEDLFRDIRNDLVQIGYKKRIPKKTEEKAEQGDVEA